MTSIRKRTWTTAAGEKKSNWQVAYKDQFGKRRTKHFPRKKDAEAWAISALAEVQRGIHTPDSVSITVAEAARLWLDSVRASDREPTTIAAYEQHVRLHIVPRCRAQKLSQLTAPKVRALLDDWLKDLSRSMATRVLRSFKAILTEAQERGLLAQNVATSIKIKKAARKQSQVMPPTKDELRRILRAAEGTDDLKGRALVELAIFSGMRASELRGLAWSAIDLKKKRVRVEQRADAAGTLGPPKSTAGFRVIPLPDRVIATLREWKLACPKHSKDLVFPSQTGRVLSHGVMTKNHLKPILIVAGVTASNDSDDKQVAKYTAHVFRHAAASLWIDQGLNPKRVQALVGHSSIQVTFDTYGHLFNDQQDDRSSALAMEKALLGAV